MPPVDLSQLSPLPAPFWFVTAFRIIGFVLHLLAMNLWLVGLPLALLFYLMGGTNGRVFARRFLKQMPIIVALGINFGVVPLLFIQTGWYKAFYPATILLAVHWFSILVLVMMAYYAIYGCARLASNGGRKWKMFLCGGLAVTCLVACGLIFASVWTFMAVPGQWPGVWEKTQVAAGVTGLGTWWRDPAVLIRFGMIVGIALLTTGFWVVFDARFLCRDSGNPSASSTSRSTGTAAAGSSPMAKLSKKEKKRRRAAGDDSDFDEEYAALEAEERAKQEKEPTAKPREAVAYPLWSVRVATALVWLGTLLSGTLLWYYLFKTLGPQTPGLEWLYATQWKFLIWGMFAALALPVLLLTIGKWGKWGSGTIALGLLLAQALVLGTFATLRLFIQNAQLAEYCDVSRIPVAVQWTPLYTFLGVFAVTLLVILWMIRQMARARG